MILAIPIYVFLWIAQGGRKGPLEAHSFIYSLGEFEREYEDEVGGIGRGQLGRFYSWRSYGS
jgi:hypothetical protein